MKFNKIFGLIFSLVMFSLILAGCQGVPTETQSTVSDESEPQTTVSDETLTQSTELSDDLVVIEIDAFNYAYSLETITVKKGQTVRIELTVTQGVHDWVLDDFSAATNQASAGNMVSVEFIADETGEFEYYCSVTNHRAMGMVGILIVE